MKDAINTKRYKQSCTDRQTDRQTDRGREHTSTLMLLHHLTNKLFTSSIVHVHVYVGCALYTLYSSIADNFIIQFLWSQCQVLASRNQLLLLVSDYHLQKRMFTVHDKK